MTTKEERLITHLDECLTAMQAGDSLEQCLARYPDGADELASLLQIAVALEQLPQPGPSPAVASAARARFLSEVDKRHATTRPGLWSRLKQSLALPAFLAPLRAVAAAALTVVMVILIGGGLVHAASGSLPGDPLYGFKLLGEDVQRTLTFSRDGRIHLEETLTARRRDEVRQLLAHGRQEDVDFGGLLRARSNGDWLVEDIPVTVAETTRVQTDPVVGTFVAIQGTTQDNGSVLATVVKIEGTTVIGFVDAISPNHWIVDGLTIPTDSRTRVEAGVQVGECVRVHARQFSDGALLALEIARTTACQEDEALATPTPTSTPSLISTPSSTPSPGPTVTVTPTPTATPTPSPSPTWTGTPAPTPSPSPTWTGTPAPTPSPETTVPPSLTPEPEQEDDEPVTPPPATEEPGDGDDNDNGDDGGDNDNDNDNGNENGNDNNGDDNGNDNGDDDINDNND